MSTRVADAAHRGHSLTHDGLLYRAPDDYVAGVVSFLRAGLDVAQPTFVAVPGPNLSLLRDGLEGASADVQFVGEPIWPGRTPAEICEATRHEAMLNTAFADAPVDILCPYDVRQLDPAVIANAWRTHPTIVDRDERWLSAHYADPERLYAGDDALRPAPPEDIDVLPVTPDDLYGVRSSCGAMPPESVCPAGVPRTWSSP
jgi:hypothetical protein